MKIKITIEYDTQGGKTAFQSNQENMPSSAAIATAMRFNGQCAEVVLMAVGAYLQKFDSTQSIGEKVMDVACTVKETNDMLKAKNN